MTIITWKRFAPPKLSSSISISIEITKKVKARVPRPIAILENTQAVTAYSLEKIQDEFYDAGATYVVLGEPEERGIELVKNIVSQGKNDQLHQQSKPGT